MASKSNKINSNGWVFIRDTFCNFNIRWLIIHLSIFVFMFSSGLRRLVMNNYLIWKHWLYIIHCTSTVHSTLKCSAVWECIQLQAECLDLTNHVVCFLIPSILICQPIITVWSKKKIPAIVHKIFRETTHLLHRTSWRNITRNWCNFYNEAEITFTLRQAISGEETIIPVWYKLILIKHN